MKNKKIFFGIAILLILNIAFILAQEIEITEEIVSFDSEKVNYKIESEYGKEITILSFVKEGGFAEIKGNRFENILPADKSLNPSYIKIDNLGNIIEADLTANEKGSTFLINGLTLKAPPNSRVNYNEEGFYLERVDILDIKKSQFVNLPIVGKRINFFNELFLDFGTVSLQEKGYIVQNGKFIYDKIEVKAIGLNEILIEKNPLKDLSKYKENFIQNTNDGLKIQSVPDALGFKLRFLEGSEIFDIIQPEESNKERSLDIEISEGDGIEITKKDFIIPGMSPLIKHTSYPGGQTIVKDGKHFFKFEDGKYLSELENLNAKDKLSAEFNLESDLLKDKAIHVDDNNGYSIYEPRTGKNVFSFNKALFSSQKYDFKSEIGEKMYSYAEEQIGNSAYVEEGRGQCYGTETEKFPGFDCIGLGIASLKKIYLGEPLKNFPPNLKLVETLEKKGWNSYVVEPAEVVGEEKAKNFVKDIPPGSIIFLMHDYGSEDSEILEGIAQQKYLNSKDEEIILTLGHTLIRGTGEKNFINARPDVLDEELPLRARKINKNLEKQGKLPIFMGAVKEGELIPQDDYLIVISPPED